MSGQHFQHVSDKTGAPSAVIYSIAQDPKGFMWFATTDGFFRYDSHLFKYYGHDPKDPATIASNYTMSVFCDANGDVWICTLNGLCRYDRKTESFQTFKPVKGDATSIHTSEVACIGEDAQKNLWIGTTSGLAKVEMNNGRTNFRHFLKAKPGRPDYAVQAIAAGEKKGIWLATSDGLAWMEKEEPVFYKASGNLGTSSGNDFTALHNDGAGTIWLAVRTGGLVRFSIASKSFESVSSFRNSKGALPEITGFTSDGNGKIWIATNTGLANFNTGTLQHQWHLNDPVNDQSPGDDALMTIYKDRSGGIWTGSYNASIDYMNTSSPVFSRWPFFVERVSKKNLTDAWIGLTPDQKPWLITRDKKQIQLHDPKSDKTTTHKLNLGSDQNPNHFYVDEHGLVWYGGKWLLTSYDLKTGKKTDYPFPKPKDTPAGRSGVIRIIQGRQQRLWVCGGFGLLWLDQKTGTLHDTGIEKGVSSVLEDTKGNVWGGGKNQVWLLRDGSSKAEKIVLNKTESSEMTGILGVWRIVEDYKGRIWLITLQGLREYNPKTHLFELRPKENSDLLKDAYDIETDLNGYLWLSRENELLRYHPDKGTLQSYSHLDGLPEKAIFPVNATAKNRNGILFFNTNQEMFSLDPGRISTDRRQGPIVISSLKLFNKEVKANDRTNILQQDVSDQGELMFRHDQNIFTLNFALLSYARSHQNKYRYRLEEFEQDWNESNVPSATYMNLPSGKYTFVVKAANGDGYWNTTPLRLTIRIQPPWWRTWYAYLFYFILFAAITYGVTRFLWLRTLVRKENEVYQAKLDFFTNISHEIRTHLSLISGPLESIVKLSETPPKTQKLLRYAKSNSDRLMALVSELLDFRKIQNGKIKLWVAEYDIVKSIKSVMAAFEHQSSQKGIALQLQAPQNPVMLWVDNAQIQKVFFNLIGNAIKFTPEGGQLSITVSELPGQVTIEFRDNGKGIAPANLKHLFSNFYQVYDGDQANTGYGIGLALSKEIALRHHGDLSVTSNVQSENLPGETTFSLRLPTGKWQSHDDQVTAKLNPEPAFMPPVSVSPIETGEFLAGTADQKNLQSVLFIEDNDELREFAVETLRERFSVLQATNGKTGLEMAKEHIPDILVCDVMMPEMNGLQVCRLIKADFNTRHIPVILISARSTPAQMMEGLEAGADDYLIKPFSFEILDLKINNLIRGREAFRKQYTKIVSLEPYELQLQDPDAEFLTRLKDLVLERLSDSGFSVDEIAFLLGTSVSVLYRKLRALTGMTVNEFIKSIRMKRAHQLLETGSFHVNEVASMVGFEDSKYFSREFKKFHGKTPNEIKKQL